MVGSDSIDIIPNPEVAVEYSLHCCLPASNKETEWIKRLSIISLSRSRSETGVKRLGPCKNIVIDSQ